VRKEMIEHGGRSLSVKRKCELLNVVRSTVYYQPKSVEDNAAVLMNEIRDIYQETPSYGYRKITIGLRQRGFVVNHKKVQNLLATAGIKAIYPAKRTTIRNSEHKVFPYLLKGMVINRPNQVWQVDITYIKMRHGFVYLVCLIDVFSRKIMGWSLSPFLDTTACIEALKKALKHGSPEIINSDQGCQFTSDTWIETLTREKIFISMDGKGRWADNVYVERLWRTIKYENVFLHTFDTVDQAKLTLGKFIKFYNEQRFHQALNYHTPDAIYELQRIPTKQELFMKFKSQNYDINQEVSATLK
jgi:putative transposase